MVRAYASWKLKIAHRLGQGHLCSCGPCHSPRHLRGRVRKHTDGKGMSVGACVLHPGLEMKEILYDNEVERTDRLPPASELIGSTLSRILHFLQ